MADVTNALTPNDNDELSVGSSNSNDTSFSESMEREEQLLKLHEIQLFGSPSVIKDPPATSKSIVPSALKCRTPGSDAQMQATFQAAEAQRILRKIDDSKAKSNQNNILASLQSHEGILSCDEGSVSSTGSESNRRQEEYQQRLSELEMFTPSAFAMSVFNQMQSGLEKLTMTTTTTTTMKQNLIEAGGEKTMDAMVPKEEMKPEKSNETEEKELPAAVQNSAQNPLESVLLESLTKSMERVEKRKESPKPGVDGEFAIRTISIATNEQDEKEEEEEEEMERNDDDDDDDDDDDEEEMDEIERCRYDPDEIFDNDDFDYATVSVIKRYESDEASESTEREIEVGHHEISVPCIAKEARSPKYLHKAFNAQLSITFSDDESASYKAPKYSDESDISESGSETVSDDEEEEEEETETETETEKSCDESLTRDTGTEDDSNDETNSRGSRTDTHTDGDTGTYDSDRTRSTANTREADGIVSWIQML
eukprot:CAMPEP_0202449780 /NCGR_PEP_ID=MMETSP1360-20130828/8485_1 /ASSEMBLY_ACC=CAM_ASM_000848 /TAXON_ID=515479 /ORGANISM="Licmophora paradoxa, Strain CCMP2313" /LENGTH=482 /DNA_ID=CAMNT_0049067817 /DNA_START=51 /DNA_END=1499 /DNA_ORIENTATION=-